MSIITPTQTLEHNVGASGFKKNAFSQMTVGYISHIKIG